jgi:hypothetical protein
MIPEIVISRFWNGIDCFGPKIPNMEEPCWTWTGPRQEKNLDRYGKVTYGGYTYLAHRISYEIFNEEISDGKLVCHHCDNPSCCKPDHLFIGTRKDNAQDYLSKFKFPKRGRHPTQFGVKIAVSKLNDDWIRFMRQVYVYGDRSFGIKPIAAYFGVSEVCVHRVVNRVTWRHVQ